MGLDCRCMDDGQTIYQRRCEIQGCQRPYYAKTWCRYHYGINRVHGNPLYKRPKYTCSVPGCSRPMRSDTYCTMHYARWAKDQPLITAKEQFIIDNPPK